LPMQATKKRGKSWSILDDPLLDHCREAINSRQCSWQHSQSGCKAKAEEKAIRGIIENTPGAYDIIDRRVDESRLILLTHHRDRLAQFGFKGTEMNRQYSDMIGILKGRLGIAGGLTHPSPSQGLQAPRTVLQSAYSAAPQTVLQAHQAAANADSDKVWRHAPASSARNRSCTPPPSFHAQQVASQVQQAPSNSDPAAHNLACTPSSISVEPPIREGGGKLARSQCPSPRFRPAPTVWGESGDASHMCPVPAYPPDTPALNAQPGIGMAPFITMPPFHAEPLSHSDHQALTPRRADIPQNLPMSDRVASMYEEAAPSTPSHMSLDATQNAMNFSESMLPRGTYNNALDETQNAMAVSQSMLASQYCHNPTMMMPTQNALAPPMW